MEQQIEKEPVNERLPTGIDVLDEQLDGGIRAGSIVLLSAEPTSQSEVFLSRLTHARPTHYVTTQRAAPAVRQSLSQADAAIEQCTVLSVDHSDPVPINQAFEHVSRLPDRSTLVIDAMNPFENGDPVKLWSFLNGVQARLEETDSLGFLHGLNGRTVPPNRGVTEYLADVVFELETDLHGEFVENRLYVPKVRGGSPIPEVIKVDLSDGVTIDTSREIA